MAELINEIISPEAFKQVSDMKAELASLTKQMEDMLKAMGKAPAVGGGNAVKNTTDAIQAQSEQMKQLQIVKNKIITTEAKLNDEYVQQAARLKELNAELRQNVNQTGLAEGSLDQMRANLNKLEKLYSAMSAEMRNAKVGQTIFADMVKAKEGVTLLEQSMGNYKRNVGNYQNSTFQLTQTLRELPAFAFSAQTGLMGISNNLPLLADAFSKVKQETGSTAGALKVFGASLFSFTNIFAVAIGLATMFLPKLIEWASGTKEVDEATKKLGESIGQQTSKFETLKRGLDDVTLSEKQRLKIAKEMKDLYPKALENYSAEEIAAGKAGKAIQTIADALVKVAMARAGEEQLAKLASDKWANEQKIAEEKKKQLELEAKLITQKGNVERANDVRSVSQENAMNTQISTYNRLNKELSDSKKNTENLNAENKKLDAQMTETANKINSYADAISLVTKPKKEKKVKKGEEPFKPEFNFDNNDQENIKKYFDELEKAFDELWKQNKPFFEERVVQDIEDSMSSLVMPTLPTDQANALNAQLMSQSSNRKKAIEDEKNNLQGLEDTIRQIVQGINAIGDLASSFIDRKLQEIDLQQKKMEEYYDAEKIAVEQLSISQEEKTKRLAALEAQRGAQQKKIDAERLQAARKQAIVEKIMNISNIIGSTAVAVIKAWTEGDPYTKLGRSIAAGAIGAAQLAAAIAAPLPQFAKGTDNAPEGFAVVGERGTELVVNPDGTSWLTPAKDTITYLKKGAKVVPNNELMDMVKYANYVNVGGIKQGETGGLFGMALVDKFDELADEVRGLKMIMANKNMSVQVSGNYDHYLHVRKNIR